MVFLGNPALVRVVGVSEKSEMMLFGAVVGAFGFLAYLFDVVLHISDFVYLFAVRFGDFLGVVGGFFDGFDERLFNESADENHGGDKTGEEAAERFEGVE